MLSTNDSPASSGDRTDRHAGLVLGAAIILTVAVALLGWYALRSQLVSLTAVALQAALVAIACWAGLNAARLRRKLREAEQYVRQVKAGERPAVRPRWAHDDEDEEYATTIDPEEAYHIAVGDVHHGRKLHYIFFAVVPTALVGLAAVWVLWSGNWAKTITVSQLPPGAETVAGSAVVLLTQTMATALGIGLLALSSVWLVLSRSFASLDADELGDGPALALALRESQWTSIIAAAALLGSLLWLPLQTWVGAVLLLWIAAVAGEQLGRYLHGWIKGQVDGRPTVPPLHVFLREAVLQHGNPITSVFETIERRYGVSFRSSWAIRFVKAAAVPTLLMAGLLFWGLSCLAMVGPSELGIRETLGRRDAQPLPPGLHFKLPWPLARVELYPVKKVFARPLGFTMVKGGEAAQQAIGLAEGDLGQVGNLLWTRSHAEEEFSIVLGSGTEVVVIDAVVYCKIREDREGLYDYAYNFQNPVAAMEAYGYRVLMEQTRQATLEEVLTVNREQFAEQIEQSLRDYCETNRLGLEIVDVSLINLHPPVDAASDYLDVISGEIDATRYEVEAAGDQQKNIQEAEAESNSAVAQAKVGAAKQTGEAIERTAQFEAIKEAYAVDPQSFKMRLRNDTLEQVLRDKSLILIDKSFSSGPGETMIDLRPAAPSGDPIPTGVN